MKVLVFGRSGQVAQELQRRSGAVTLEVHGSDTADFRDPDRCAEILAGTTADAVINAAAYTAVDAAETDAETAFRINAETPAMLARTAARRAMPFVQLSTDYVFDGTGDQPWSVDAPTAPLGAYGRSKLAGEEAVRRAAGPHAILRTSWVVSAHGKNFVKTMLRVGAQKPSLNIVADQIGGPTAAADLSDACLHIARFLHADPASSGTYHFAGTPTVSWADFAREIFRQAEMATTVVDIPTSEFPRPAPRPLNSRLDTSLTEAVFGLTAPDWRTGLSHILADLGPRRPPSQETSP